jgi:tetratricopeptide (TPR) repeat protein
VRHNDRANEKTKFDVAEDFPATPACFLLIVGAAVAAYHNSFWGPLVFDDIPAIIENFSIRHLWSLRVLTPPQTAGTVGRPIVNLAMAINYALGGVRPVGYHIANLCLHVLVALTLFGILQRTLQLPSLKGLFGEKSRLVALSITLLWTVHPLLTQSVTYIMQRTELIVGAFYLLTFYCFIRSIHSARKAFWYRCAVFSSLLGMLSKEVMATAPVMILLFDRAFVSGSFRKAWTQRRQLYLGLAATWILLGLLALGNRDRNDTVGFGHGVAWWQYAFTQCEAIVGYLGLALWPRKLIFDYGTEVVSSFSVVWPQALVLLALLSATVVQTLRRPKLGFLGCWFFGILAPSSSIIPLTTQTVAEQRMYLPLIAVVALLTIGLLLKVPKKAGLVALALLVPVLGLRTVQRNKDYKSAFTLWSDTVNKRPHNARAYNELGNIVDAMGKTSEALSYYDKALKLNPNYAKAYHNKGETFLKNGQVNEAIEQFDIALHIKPDYFKALKGMGDALIQAGRSHDAILAYEKALQLNPDDIAAADNLGMALLGSGRVGEAIDRFESVLRVDPEDGEAHGNLGAALLQKGEVSPALTHFEVAIRQLPDSAQVHYNYAKALKQAGRVPEAVDEYRKVVQLKPDHAVAYYNMGNAYAQIGQLDQAIFAYEAAVKIKPDYAEAHNNYGSILRRQSRIKEAQEQYLLALKYRPDYLQAQNNLAALLKSSGGQ